MMLQAAGIQARLGGNAVLRGVDLRADAGEVLGLVGPNGSGKTTLLRSFYRAQSISAGLVTLDGADVAQQRRRVIAQRIGVSTQESANLGGITVRESIALGRTAHRGWLEPMGAGDREIIERVLAQTGLTEFAERDAAALSGGERQRIAIARALAQQPQVLLLDEPTNHLDLRHQLLVLELLRTLAADGLAVVVTLHDLRLAAQFCDRIAVLNEGRIVADGPTQQALAEDLLAAVFGVRGRVRARPDGGLELDVMGLADV